SRNHAQILESHGTYFLEDLRSRNGTLLNGERIQGRSELKDGDEVRVCEVVMRFYQGAPPKTEATPVPAPPPAPKVTGPPQDRATTIPDVSALAPLLADPTGRKFFDEDGSDSSSIITSLEMSSSMHPRIAVRPEAKLRAVMEISQNLARTLKTDEVLPRIL